MGVDNICGIRKVDDDCNPLRKGLIEAFGGIPVSSRETTLYIRAVEGDGEAERIVIGGFGFDDRLGFNGCGIPLGSNEGNNLNEIDETHRGWPVVEFFALPNIRREVIDKLQAEGINYEEVPTEVLFAEPYEPNQDQIIGQSSMMVNSRKGVLLPNIFFKGYYDKGDHSWHPNSLYWESSLERESLVSGAMTRLENIIGEKKKVAESLDYFKIT